MLSSKPHECLAAAWCDREAAIRMGRRNLVAIAMAASGLLASLVGFVATDSYSVAVVALLMYGALIWLDSATLTAGAAGSAEPSRRGAQLAVHSTLGYAGGFVGPLVIGFVLDAGGGMSRTNWGYAFLAIAFLILITLAAFWLLDPRDLAGDRPLGQRTT